MEPAHTAEQAARSKDKLNLSFGEMHAEFQIFFVPDHRPRFFVWLDRLRKIRCSSQRAQLCRHIATRGFTAHP